MIDFKTFCQITSMVQVIQTPDVEMDEHLHKMYKKYLQLGKEDRENLEEHWRDLIRVPAHTIVNFYNAFEEK